MFTGIIQDIGEVKAIDKKGDWTITIGIKKLPIDLAAIGASICCNGVCLTVIEKGSEWFKVQVSSETLAKTTIKNWVEGTKVNLEPALRVGDELGGHLVSGHVDGIAFVTNTYNDRDSLRFLLKVPHEHAKFIASKGSIALNGVSLTVNEVENDQFGVNIIPHTLQETTFGVLKVGEQVNFEVDLMARYAERLLNQRN